MKVVLISCVFPPEHTYSSQTSLQIAEELVRRGHSVQVYAPFPSHPKGKLFDGYKRSFYSTTVADTGYILTHCFSTFSRRSTPVSRFAANITFGISSGLRVLFGRRPDVIYSNSWPIFATGIVAIAAKLRHSPLVLRVQDIYPESLESQRLISRQSWIYHLLRRLDRIIARSSDQLAVLSPVFQRVYKNDRRVQAECIHVIPNWSNDEFVDTDPSAGRKYRRKMRIPENAFVAIYAGNVGVASNAEMLVDAMAKLIDWPQIYMVIAGDGSQLKVCMDKVAQQHLDRVVIHTPWKKDETGPVLQIADVLLLPTKGRQSINSIPSKLITYMLSGRPLIASVLSESDTATEIYKSGSGWVIEPDSADIMARTIAMVSALPKENLVQMGSAGREYACRNFTTNYNLPRIIDVVEKAAKIR